MPVAESLWPFVVRRRVVVRGVVQGVGFRPHVYALARSLDLSGAVWNTGHGVVAEVEGDSANVETFVRRLGDDAPPLALVSDVTTEDLPLVGGTGFTIRESEQAPGRTFVSPDVTICDDCLADLRDPANRRYRHPFVTCTNCGPRFTITTGLPYDRPTTTMAGFPMCAACAAEYADPADRRFHAQTVCCPDCGPTLRLVAPGRRTSYAEDALAEARSLLRDGAVVAVKGIGGYHLACDATQRGGGRDAAQAQAARRQAVRGDGRHARRRARDRRPRPPTEAALLTGRSRPIVLASPPTRRRRRRRRARPGATSGVMLAYAPLHHLLLGLPATHRPGPGDDERQPAGEPIVTDDDEALDRLAGLADAWLTHDRPIHVPCDDSVTRAVGERRGAGPPVARVTRRCRSACPSTPPPSLAVGGDLKNTFCLAEGRLAWMSGHIGDMDDLATLARVRRRGPAPGDADRRRARGGSRPTATRRTAPARWALDRVRADAVVEVQHHHAHVASTMAEHGLVDGRRVLGVAFDGTGYGDDGAVVGRRVPGRRLPRRTSGPRTSPTSRCPAATPACATRAGWRSPTCAAPASTGTPRLPERAGLRRRRARAARPPARDRAAAARPPRAWAGSSTRSRRSPASATGPGTTPRPRWSSRRGAAVGARSPATVRRATATPRPVVRGRRAADVRRGRRSPGWSPPGSSRPSSTCVVDRAAPAARGDRRRHGHAQRRRLPQRVPHRGVRGGPRGRTAFEVLRHHVVPASDAGIALGQVAVLAHRRTSHHRSSREQEQPCA